MGTARKIMRALEIFVPLQGPKSVFFPDGKLKHLPAWPVGQRLRLSTFPFLTREVLNEYITRGPSFPAYSNIPPIAARLFPRINRSKSFMRNGVPKMLFFW
jgi:hypothetical protein